MTSITIHRIADGKLVVKWSVKAHSKWCFLTGGSLSAMLTISSDARFGGSAHGQVYECRRVAVKRDMDLIRDILLKAEADPKMNGSRFVVFDTSDFEGHSQDEIAYHIDLLFEEDFVKGAATLD